jgi:hypothetical protein
LPAVAFEIEPRVKPSRKTAYHSAEGRSEARRAKRPIIAFVFAVAFIFPIFRPKIACQAPKPPNPNKQNKIELAY